MNKLKDTIIICGLLLMVFTGVFILTTALSDIADYKSGLYVQGMEDSKSISDE